MRRYILLQYMHIQNRHDAFSVRGTFEDLRDARAFADKQMQDFNEIIDTNTWSVVWRLNKSAGWDMKQ